MMNEFQLGRVRSVDVFKDNFHSNAAIEESLKTTNMIIDELKRGRG